MYKFLKIFKECVFNYLFIYLSFFKCIIIDVLDEKKEE